MPIYEVRPGLTHGAHNQHKGGDLVEMTAQEAAGFADKLREVRPEPPAPQPKPAVLPAETGGGAAPSLPAAPGQTAAVEEMAGEWPAGLSNALVRLLRQHGFESPETVKAARDEDLLAAEGIGDKALARIREAFARE